MKKARRARRAFFFEKKFKPWQRSAAHPRFYVVLFAKNGLARFYLKSHFKIKQVF